MLWRCESRALGPSCCVPSGDRGEGPAELEAE